MIAMSAFKERIYIIVRTIPHGKVASYGQIALMAGIPRAARQVGWFLRQTTPEQALPWWRIINNKGYISIKNNECSALEQKKLLEKEGIEVNGNFELDIKKYRYVPTNEEMQKLELPQELLEKLFKLI
jgi:methylated-DNA-protein-cysteine methyltransferase related protein